MPSKTALKKEVTALVHETRDRALLVSRAALLLWMVEALDLFVFRGGLDHLGIRPRETGGLLSILLAPFLHGGFGHLAANTLPFLVLGFLVTARKRMDFWVVAVGSALISGLGTWMTGAAGSVHIGASGVVFGFLGFLMGRGIHERKAGAILLSLGVTFFFGGMLWGLLPTVGPGISWQGHLFGWLGGLLISRLLGRELEKKGGKRR